MGGLVGPGFIKFVVTAGLLHCPIDVNLHRADAVLDPRLATSLISGGFAHRLHLAAQGSAQITAYGVTALLPTTGPVSVGIHPASFPLARLAIEDPATEQRAPAKADIVLGADALASAPLRLDLRRKQLSSISSGDAHRATKGMTAVDLSVDEAGHLLVHVRIGDAAPVPALLDLGSEQPITISRQFATDQAPDRPIALFVDTIAFGQKPVRVSDQTNYPVTIGAALFADKVIILDLSRRKLWISG